MSRAKEKSLEKYPYKEGYDVELPYPSTYDENKDQREAFIEGYHQAEKDLELTWEDIPEIFRISEQLKTSWWFRDYEQTKLIGTQVFWEEVLKRFKERKVI